MDEVPIVENNGQKTDVCYRGGAGISLIHGSLLFPSNCEQHQDTGLSHIKYNRFSG